MLLSTVQMVPTSEIFDFPDGLMTLTHLLGAQFCFVGYLSCEAAALLDNSNADQMETTENIFLWELFLIGAIAMGTFGIVYLILSIFTGKETNPYVRLPLKGMSDLYDKERLHRALDSRASG